MATYAIGDIQGCFAPLQRLLRRLALADGDRLWLVGDLVNRGPHSLEVLRWAKALGPRCMTVLGNHDLHLLARAAGVAGPKRRDTLDELLAAPDLPDLVDWLRHQPLLYREDPYVVVHAGLRPEWTVAQAEQKARAAEALLQGPGWRTFLAALHGGAPAVGAPSGPDGNSAAGAASKPDKATRDAIAFIAAATRMRMLQVERAKVTASDTSACDTYSGPPDAAPAGCVPWFDHPRRRNRDATIVFGHWSALGLRLSPGLIATDSGCVWGRSLSAVRLDDRAVFDEPAHPI